MAIVNELKPRPGDLARRVLPLLLARTAENWHVLLPDGGNRGEAPDAVVIGSTGVFVVRFADRLPDRTAAQALVDDVDRWSSRIRAGAGSEVLASSAIHEAFVVPENVHVADTRDRRVEVITESRVSDWLRNSSSRLSRRPRDHIARQIAALLPGYASHSVDQTSETTSADGFFGADELQSDLLESAQDRPFEQWMTFLHPDQQDLVTRKYKGPARISGPAGTGKTVVALHRLRYLARRSTGPLLFTTFVRTLPAVHETTFNRLAPEFADRVEFVNLHAWARAFLGRRGIEVPIDHSRVTTAFSWAWKTHRATLEPIEKNPDYWRTEIGRVIKGRGIRTFDEYREIDRPGRTVRLGKQRQRQPVWDLYETYQANLRERETFDYEDTVEIALREVIANPLDEPYAAVVVDEVQDITLTGLRLLRELAGDGPDGLLLVGDGQQQVYPGGWRLSDAGIPIQGRGAVLKVNYRNRADLLAFAQRFNARDVVDDLDGAAGVALREVEVANPGGSHRAWQGPRNELGPALTSAVETLAPALDVTAVIAFSRHDVDMCAGILRAAKIPFVRLEDYRGEVDKVVKIGTVHRAKGLDFQNVLVVDSAYGLPSDTAAAAEHRELRDRQRLVAATRARDFLWWGTLE